MVRFPTIAASAYDFCASLSIFKDVWDQIYLFRGPEADVVAVLRFSGQESNASQ